MKTEESRKLVLAYYSALRSGDPADLERVLAEDVVWASPPSAPIASPFKGRDVVLKEMHASGERFFDLPTLKVVTKKIVADGDTVVVLQSLSGKAANGRNYANEYVWVFTCADGKIIRMDEHNDSHRFHQIVIGD